jgi:uncharacterized protein with PIN domain
MKQAHLRFYEELNEYLPEEKKKRSFGCRFAGQVTVQRLLRALGVPGSQVDLIVCNSESVSLSYLVRDGDRISIYPVFESLDIKGITKVRAEPLRHPCFAVGPGLERLAAYLRMLGFDTCSSEGRGAAEVVAVTEAEGRIFLTRECPPREALHALQVRGVRPRQQAEELLERLDLHRLIKPLGRCPRCNVRLTTETGPLHCQACSRLYHDGTHLRRMRCLIDHVSSGGGQK